MEIKICLDSDFLINLLRNKEPEVNFVKQNENTSIFATTPINLFELYHGAFKKKDIKEVIAIELLREKLKILDLNEETSRKGGEIAAYLSKIGRSIDFRDLLIGVICLINGFHLKTYNTSDFSRIEGLKLV